ncbi:hypothetical protein KNO81_39300 [Paraburkholderia sediminicola]|jgi:hypothetical protein|nr:hypothetical protein [Paraburkholderia sediminicola]
MRQMLLGYVGWHATTRLAIHLGLIELAPKEVTAGFDQDLREISKAAESTLELSTSPNEDGLAATNAIVLTLYDIAGTSIRRHRKITAAANPPDVQWESYFEERLGFAMLDSIKGRVRLIRLSLDQRRSCPVCLQMITESSG